MDNRRIYCPLPEYRAAWIELPPEWLGEHAKRRDDVVERVQHLSVTERQFAISIALMENWNIPGLGGNPEAWDFSKLNLKMIAWINQEVLNDFAACFIVPKGLSSPLQIGSAEGIGNLAGDSRPTEPK